MAIDRLLWIVHSVYCSSGGGGVLIWAVSPVAPSLVFVGPDCSVVLSGRDCGVSRLGEFCW